MDCAMQGVETTATRRPRVCPTTGLEGVAVPLEAVACVVIHWEWESSGATI